MTNVEKLTKGAGKTKYTMCIMEILLLLYVGPQQLINKK